MKEFSGVRRVKEGPRSRIVIDFPYNDADGGRRRFQQDATAQDEATALLEAARLMKHAAETGLVVKDRVRPGPAPAPAPTGLTYRAFVEGAFETQFMPMYRPATRERYKALHRQTVMAFFGDMYLDAIGPAEYREFAALIQRTGILTKGPVTMACTVLRAAHDSGHLDELPPLPRGLVKTSRKLPDAPSFEDFRIMLTASGWLGVAIALAGFAGLRSGELRALEVRDVDLEGGRLVVRRALSEDVSLTPKSGHERMVPLVPELADRLRSVMKNKLPRARVILDDKGGTPRRQDVLRLFKLFLAKKGLRERSFHSLRHFFITELVRRGVGLEAVRVLAGHSKLDMTQRYAHATAADLHAAMKRLGE